MISMNYVNNDSPNVIIASDDYQFESVFSKMYKDASIICESVRTDLEQYLFDIEISGADYTREAVILESNQNVFEKIGETIRKTFEAIIKMISDAITNIKDSSFKAKSDYEKIAIYSKKASSDEANEILKAVNAGTVDIKNLKSIEEMRSAYLEFLQLAKDDTIDPNTLKGKLQIMKEKMAKTCKEHPIIVAAGAVTTLSGAISGILKVRNDINNIHKEYTAKCAQDQKNVLDLLATINSSKSSNAQSQLIKGGITNENLKQLNKAELISIATDVYTGNVSKAFKDCDKWVKKEADNRNKIVTTIAKYNGDLKTQNSIALKKLGPYKQRELDYSNLVTNALFTKQKENNASTNRHKK